MSRPKEALGIVEYGALASFVLVVAGVAFAVATGWAIAVAPALTYIMALGAAYLMYRHHRIQSAPVEHMASTTLEAVSPSAESPVLPLGGLSPTPAVTFCAVGARGTCPLGYGEGTLVSLDSTGAVYPPLCAYAEAVLRLAATREQESVKEWCCPIPEHQLVFRRMDA